MRTLFQKRCRNRIKITIGVRILKQLARQSSIVTGVKEEKQGGVNGEDTHVERLKRVRLKRRRV